MSACDARRGGSTNRASQRISKTLAEPFRVKLGSAALKVYQRLPPADRHRVRAAMERLAERSADEASRGGKTVKSIQGARDDFRRLRVGDLRVMFEVKRDDKVILVLGVIHRAQLETWLRKRR